MMRAAFFRAVSFLAVRTQLVRRYLSGPAIMHSSLEGIFPFTNSRSGSTLVSLTNHSDRAFTKDRISGSRTKLLTPPLSGLPGTVTTIKPFENPRAGRARAPHQHRRQAS